MYYRHTGIDFWNTIIGAYNTQNVRVKQYRISGVSSGPLPTVYTYTHAVPGTCMYYYRS